MSLSSVPRSSSYPQRSQINRPDLGFHPPENIHIDIKGQPRLSQRAHTFLSDTAASKYPNPKLHQCPTSQSNSITIPLSALLSQLLPTPRLTQPNASDHEPWLSRLAYVKEQENPTACLTRSEGKMILVPDGTTVALPGASPSTWVNPWVVGQSLGAGLEYRVRSDRRDGGMT